MIAVACCERLKTKGVSGSDRLKSYKLKTPWDEEIHKHTANVSQEAEHLKEAANFTFKPVSSIQVQVPLSENLRYQ